MSYEAAFSYWLKIWSQNSNIASASIIMDLFAWISTTSHWFKNMNWPNHQNHYSYYQQVALHAHSMVQKSLQRMSNYWVWYSWNNGFTRLPPVAGGYHIGLECTCLKHTLWYRPSKMQKILHQISKYLVWYSWNNGFTPLPPVAGGYHIRLENTYLKHTLWYR